MQADCPCICKEEEALTKIWLFVLEFIQATKALRVNPK